MKAKIDDAVDALRRAFDIGHGRPAVMFTGGKDSMILADLIRRHDVPEPHFGVIDTGNQLPSIYTHRERIEDEWGIDLDVRRNDEFIEDVIENPNDDRGYAWDGPKTEGCCGALKIDVMGDFIADGYDPLIVGRRAEDVGGHLSVVDTEIREPVPHARVHPLADWSTAHVKAYITKYGVPLPDAYADGYDHTDCVDCVFKGEDGDDWADASAAKREQLNQLRDMGYM